MKNLLNVILKYCYKIVSRLDFNLGSIIYYKNYFLFRNQKKKWLKNGGKIHKNFMILNDYSDNAGEIKTHYFHQDLLVAGFIFKDNPERHIDVGSRIDGFVMSVASFRKIEVLDIRPLPKSEHKNIKFTQADLLNSVAIGKADSLSCLHAIEHFGLGRYGDSIDINGHQKGICNLIKLIRPNGKLYISLPIGLKDEVHFNAHRIFHPQSIFAFKNVNKDLKLLRFDYVDDKGNLHLNKNVNDAEGKNKYGCGIYTFLKL
jgi:hypothetical protein